MLMTELFDLVDEISEMLGDVKKVFSGQNINQEDIETVAALGLDLSKELTEALHDFSSGDELDKTLYKSGVNNLVYTIGFIGNAARRWLEQDGGKYESFEEVGLPETTAEEIQQAYEGIKKFYKEFVDLGSLVDQDS